MSIRGWQKKKRGFENGTGRMQLDIKRRGICIQDRRKEKGLGCLSVTLKTKLQSFLC